MNTSMLLPQVAEKDVVNAKGQRKDDINSLAEYFSIALGYDRTADDEDDDSGQNFHLTNTCDYFYTQEVVILETKFTTPVIHSYTGYTQRRISNPSYDITAPPPKA